MMILAFKAIPPGDFERTIPTRGVLFELLLPGNVFPGLVVNPNHSLNSWAASQVVSRATVSP